MVTGQTEEELWEAETATCKQISFYGSTPAYRPVLESIGIGDMRTSLTEFEAGTMG